MGQFQGYLIRQHFKEFETLVSTILAEFLIQFGFFDDFYSHVLRVRSANLHKWRSLMDDKKEHAIKKFHHVKVTALNSQAGLVVKP